MLLDIKHIQTLLSKYEIVLRGILHIGAHNCEELNIYDTLGVSDVIWIDAMADKVAEGKKRGIQHIYEAVVSDSDDKDIVFNVSNNVQSSSILEFGTHAVEHPSVVFIDKIHKKSITVDTFFERMGLDMTKYNFWNFDIQGAELMALKGATKALEYVDILYLEVNVKELYIGCPLIEDLDAFLLSYNFKRAFTTITPHGWGDAIYVKIKK